MKIKKTITIEIEVPAELADLEVPATLSLDAWTALEKERITGLYPFIKGGVTEVGPELMQMYLRASQEAKFWETKRQLICLKVLEAIGFGKKAAGNGQIFAERRDYPVAEHPVSDFRVNAVFPTNS